MDIIKKYIALLILMLLVTAVAENFTDAAPEYKYSHERLAVLRSVKDPMAHPSIYQYITNSIRELVEYPESNLIHFLR